MSTTSNQDHDFIEHITNDRVLETAIDWISDNLSPEDVFNETDLRDWALNNGFKG